MCKLILHSDGDHFLFSPIRTPVSRYIDCYSLAKISEIYFVDAKILLTPTFCQPEYFVDANIVLTRVFVYFVDSSILSTPKFY